MNLAKLILVLFLSITKMKAVLIIGASKKQLLAHLQITVTILEDLWPIKMTY